MEQRVKRCGLSSRWPRRPRSACGGDPVTLVGEGICRQGDSSGVSRKQGRKIQRISLDIKVGYGCQIFQITDRIRCVPAFLNEIVSKVLQRRILSDLALFNLLSVTLPCDPG